ncbi:unnamed protein product, partial [Polarella glacialis]
VVKCPGQNNIMTYTVPHLLKEFDLTHSELGVFFSVATVSAGMVQPPLGILADRFGGRVCITITQVALGVTLFCFSKWQPPSYRPMLYAEVVAIFFFL